MKRADSIHRVIAKVIDFVIVGVLYSFPGLTSIGILASLTYLLISDGLFHGQSVGKRLVGIKVIVEREDGGLLDCRFHESLVRNIPFALTVVLGSFLVLWFLFLPLAIIIVAGEAYFAYADEKGLRIGDVFAGTMVVDVKPQES